MAAVFITSRTVGEGSSALAVSLERHAATLTNPARFLHTIQYTRGVRHVLHFGATPVRVDEEIIQNIRDRIGTDGCIPPRSKPFVSGEHVSVNDGPLRGLRGIFKEEMRDGKRVLLLLEVLGVSAQVMMDKRFLRSVS